jgi:hypothetical protein
LNQVRQFQVRSTDVFLGDGYHQTQEGA